MERLLYRNLTVLCSSTRPLNESEAALWNKPHCFSYVNRNSLALEQHDLHKESNEVCMKTGSTAASLSFNGLVAELRAVNWSIVLHVISGILKAEKLNTAV